MNNGALRELVGEELARPAPPGAMALARELATRGGTACAAVLYYGSTLRAGSLDGILDFYVLMDDVRAWPAPPLARLAARVLPPNVGYMEFVHEGERLRAKYAVIGIDQFVRRLQVQSGDTTIWARFCQPVLCLWARSDADRSQVAELAGTAVCTASRWAALLGPGSGTAVDFWKALFAHTYSAELRVEQSGRPGDIVDKDPTRYVRMLVAGWRAQSLQWEALPQDRLVPSLSVAEKATASRRWRQLQRRGPRLNILRLLKAAFTFDGAMDYVAWKIERHRGVRIEVTDWQRRHPLLAAPGLYWRLRRQGIIGR